MNRALRYTLVGTFLSLLLACGSDTRFATFDRPSESYTPSTTPEEDKELSELIEVELTNAAVYAREIIARSDLTDLETSASRYERKIKTWSEDYGAVVVNFRLNLEPVVARIVEDREINVLSLYEDIAQAKQALLLDFDSINRMNFNNPPLDAIKQARVYVNDEIDAEFYIIWLTATFQ